MKLFKPSEQLYLLYQKLTPLIDANIEFKKKFYHQMIVI